MRLFAWILAAEIGAAAFAVIIFRLIEDRPFAGLWAGAVFLALGFVISALGVQSRAFRSSWTFRVGCVHLLGIALPMLATRVVTWGTDFSKVSVFGIGAAHFHGLARFVFIALVAGTVVDMVRASERKHGRL